MAIIKCKMCGGDLHIEEGSTVCECEYCGTRQTVPSADNEKKLTLFNRAGRLLRACEFDKAAGVFETIVADFPEEAEAYWGLVLCKYGIEYVDDPATGKKIPTCHRSSFDNVLDDPNFEQACENTDAVARRVYRDEARAIEDLRQAILSVSGREEPYDVFISYKETDENGERTLDSVIAQDIYKEMTSEGYRVFFSRISLERKLGTEYEPYIFAALNSAKVMIVVGTDYENFDSVWVKNEWSRFLKLIAAGQKKTLIPVFKNMDAYDMPKEFNKLAALDMGKVGAMQDLVHGVEKIIESKKTDSAPVQQPTYVSNEAEAKAAAAVKRGRLALEESNWERAKVYFEQALTLDAECAEAYFGMALAEMKHRNAAEYVQHASSQEPEQKTLSISRDSKHIQAAAVQYLIPHFYEVNEISLPYQRFNLDYCSTVDGQKKLLETEKTAFENNRNISLAYRFAKGSYQRELEEFQNALYSALENNVRKAERAEQEAKDKKRAEYTAFLERTDKQVEDLYNKKQGEREEKYQKACTEYETISTSVQCQGLRASFLLLSDYKDSMEYVRRCDARMAELEAKEREEQEERRKEQIYANHLKAFDREATNTIKEWEIAESGFESLGNYKDASDLAKKCAERIAQIKSDAEAKELAAAEEAERQRRLKEKAEKEKKTRQKRFGVIAGVIAVVAIAAFFLVTKVIIPGNQYRTAVRLYEDGLGHEDFSEGYKTYEEALDAFRLLPDKEKAVSFYSERAEAGDVAAMFYMGKLYDRGICVEQDYQQAKEWYLKAVDGGNTYAMNNIGWMYYNGNGFEKDYHKAMEWYLKAADGGNAVAMNNIGWMYDRGNGVKQDYQKALEWYLKSSNAGNANAMKNIGSLYDEGNGVEQDSQKAFEWYLKAAEAGDTNGMGIVGSMYANGTGVTQDYDLAMEWFTKAAEAGDAQGMRNIGAIYENRDNDPGAAMKWYLKAADAGDTEAMLYIATYYLAGHGVKQDDKKALEWTLKAAELGDAEAMLYAGKYYFEGTGTTSDYEKAAYWFEKSAEAGNATAMGIIGQMYEEGVGVEENAAKANEWAAKAKAAGYQS